MTVTAVSERLLRVLQMIHRYKGAFVGPRPDWQGRTWSDQEVAQLIACCEITLLPKEYEGQMIIMDAGRLSVVGAEQMPYLLTHRYTLNDTGREIVSRQPQAQGTNYAA